MLSHIALFWLNMGHIYYCRKERELGAIADVVVFIL